MERQTEVATYIELCTRLSRFVQLPPMPTHAKALDDELQELVAFYDCVECAPTALAQAANDCHGTPLVGLAAMDDLALLSLHRLLGGFVMRSATPSAPRLQERAFVALARVLRRCRHKLVGAGQLQRWLSYVQSCVLYLPAPPEAKDQSDTTPDSTEDATLASQPEELRLAVLQSLLELFESQSGGAPNFAQQMDQQQMHFFAYVVASLLHVAGRDRCRDAALRAVQTLASVLALINDAQALRQFLPGISAGLWKCANTPQQASRVVVAALECLASALRLCIADDRLPAQGDDSRREGEQEPRFTLETIRQAAKDAGVCDVKKNATKQERDTSVSSRDSWLDTTAVNLDLLLSRMFAVSATASAVVAGGTGLQRSSWRVRCALAGVCGTVMLQCRRALRASFFRCYDELLVLHGDPIAEVAHAASVVLQELQTSVLSADERLQLLPEMASRFQMLLATLELKLSTEHESTKVHMVRTLRGYLGFLGSDLTPYVDAAVETVYNALCHVLELDALDIELVVHQKLADPSADSNENSEASATSGVVVSQFQKRLRYFHEEASVREVLELVHETGTVCTPAGFIDCAFSLLRVGNADVDGVASRRAEVVLVLNELLRAHCRYDDHDKQESEGSGREGSQIVDVHLIGRVLEDLLALEAWREQTMAASASSTRTRALVTQRALMVECIGVCAEILRSDFHVFLLHVLYPLVEQLGSRDVEVERAALAALGKIYFFCGYDSLDALFEANMDYFVDALCARLEELESYPMTAFVVEALLRHTRLAALPLVDEVASSLLRSVDLYQDSPHIGGLLRALQLLLNSITRDAEEGGAAASKSKAGTEVSQQEKTTAPGSLLASFISEMKMLASEGAAALDIELDEESNELEPTAEEQTVTPSVKGAMPLEYDEIQQNGGDDDQEAEGASETSGYRALVIDILDRCGYFLAECDPIACCLVLSVIDEGVRFLKNPRKQLLPLVARLWPELLPRLQVANRVIVAATVRVVTTMAETAGDFVGDRFVETVWPVLRSHLQAIDFDVAEERTPKLTRSMLLLSTSSDSEPLETPGPVDVPKEPGLEASTGDELASARSTRKTQEVRLLLAILSCLTTVCQRSPGVSLILPEILRSCSKFLSRRAPHDVVQQTSELFVVLEQLNGDEVFCTVAALANWTPPSPPSSRFAVFEPDAASRFYRGYLANVHGKGQSCRENAAVVMRRLYC